MTPWYVMLLSIILFSFLIPRSRSFVFCTQPFVLSSIPAGESFVASSIVYQPRDQNRYRWKVWFHVPQFSHLSQQSCIGIKPFKKSQALYARFALCWIWCGVVLINSTHIIHCYFTGRGGNATVPVPVILSGGYINQTNRKYNQNRTINSYIFVVPLLDHYINTVLVQITISP